MAPRPLCPGTQREPRPPARRLSRSDRQAADETRARPAAARGEAPAHVLPPDDRRDGLRAGVHRSGLFFALLQRARRRAADRFSAARGSQRSILNSPKATPSSQPRPFAESASETSPLVSTSPCTDFTAPACA